MELYTMLMQRLPAYFDAGAATRAGRLGRSPPREPTGSRGRVEDEMMEESKRLLKFLGACAYSALRPVLRRGRAHRRGNLAAWDPRGATSYANVDMGSRSVTWTVALAYDWLHPRLTPGAALGLLGDAQGAHRRHVRRPDRRALAHRPVPARLACQPDADDAARDLRAAGGRPARGDDLAHHTRCPPR